MSTPLPQAFDATHAEAYDRSLERLLPIKATVHHLLRWYFAGLPDAARILVAGAGTAAEVRFLAPLFPGWRFTLVDPSAAMLEVGRRHAVAEGFADRCELHVGPVSSLEADGFDAATSVLVSHFLADAADREAYFAAIARRVRPGGRLFEAALCAELDAPGFEPLMDLWIALAGLPEERQAPFRGAFGRTLAAHGPREVEAMITRAGFGLPTPVFQAGLIRGWGAVRQARTHAPVTPSLSTPLALPCGAVLPNRLAKSAMSENLGGADHAPDERLERLYARWGQGGAGLLLTGNVMVDRRALGEPHNVVIEDARALDALRRWADASQRHGSATWVQLNHPGRQSPATLSKEPVAPSAVPLRLPGAVFRPPRALTEAEIVDLVGRFGRAAGVCRQAGFAGVQVHGAHGYLVSQFLSPLSNQRDDGWGGDSARRRRFLVEVVRAIRAEVGPAYPVGVKLNSADFQRGGFTEEESMEVVSVLEAEGVDLLEISGGTYEKPQMTGVPQRASTVAREAYFLEYAQKVRGRTKMPLWLTGGFRTRAGMEAALASGAVDVIGIARPMALEPELPRGLLDGSVTESRVAPRRTGVRQLDALLEVSWYTWQLHRIAAGKEPDPGVWPWTVLAGMGWDALTGR